MLWTAAWTRGRPSSLVRSQDAERSETSLLTPGVPSPLVPLPSYIRPISPLSSRRGPRGWESRSASFTPVREPWGEENQRKSLLQALPWLSRPALVGRICRSSTAMASLLGSGPSLIPSPPCLHSGSPRASWGGGNSSQVVLRGQRCASPRWTPSSGLSGRAASRRTKPPLLG